MEKGFLRELGRQQRKDQILLLRVASTGQIDITSQLSPSYKNKSPHLNDNLKTSFLGGGVYSNSSNSKKSLRSPLNRIDFQPDDGLVKVREHWSRSNYDSIRGGQFQQLLNEREYQLSQPKQNSSGSNPTIKRQNILHREISLFNESPTKNNISNYETSSNKLKKKINLQSYLSNEVSEYNQVEKPIWQNFNIISGLSQENKISMDQVFLNSQIAQHLQQIKSLEDEIQKQKFLAKDSLDQFIKIERSYADLEQELWALKIEQLGKNGVKNIEEQQLIKIEQLEQQILSYKNQFKSLEYNELKLKQRITQLEQQKKSYKHCLNCSGEKTDPRIVNYAERIIELEKLNDHHNNRLSVENSIIDELKEQCTDLKFQNQNLNQVNQVLQNELESLELTYKSQYQLKMLKIEDELLNKNKQVDQLLMKLRIEENRNKNSNEQNSQNQLQIISDLNKKVYDLNQHIIIITKSFESETEINNRTSQDDLQTWKKNFINLNVQYHSLQEKHVMLEAELENKIKQDLITKKKQITFSLTFKSIDRRGSLSQSYIFSQTEEMAISKQFRGSIQEESVKEDCQTSDSIALQKLPEGAILPGTEKRSLRSVMQKVIKKTEQPSLASVVQEVIRQKHLPQVPTSAQIPTLGQVPAQSNAPIIINQRKNINPNGSEQSSISMQSQRMN